MYSVIRCDWEEEEAVRQGMKRDGKIISSKGQAESLNPQNKGTGSGKKLQAMSAYFCFLFLEFNVLVLRMYLVNTSQMLSPLSTAPS